MVNGWFCMTYAVAFVKCDVFVCIICYKYMYNRSAFDAIYSINHMDVWIKFPVDVLITDEISHGGL